MDDIDKDMAFDNEKPRRIVDYMFPEMSLEEKNVIQKALIRCEISVEEELIAEKILQNEIFLSVDDYLRAKAFIHWVTFIFRRFGCNVSDDIKALIADASNPINLRAH